jgi:hypothetical protein
LIAVVGPLLKARKAIEQQTDDLDRQVLKLARYTTLRDASRPVDLAGASGCQFDISANTSRLTRRSWGKGVNCVSTMFLTNALMAKEPFNVGTTTTGVEETEGRRHACASTRTQRDAALLRNVGASSCRNQRNTQPQASSAEQRLARND